MKACPGCSVWIPDDAAFCPSCGKTTAPGGAASPGPTPPSPSPSPSPSSPAPPEPPPAPAFDRAKAESRVRLLGTLFMVAGGWTILSSLWQLGMLFTGRALEQLEALRDHQFFRENPEFQRGLETYLDVLQEPGIAAIPLILALGIGALYLWSGLQLRDLRGKTMAFASAILLIVLFPCSSECCGCCFTIPLGIGALIVLTRADTELVMRA